MTKRLEYLIKNSKNLRASQTPWENKLWFRLRGNRFQGLKFKRQVVIEKYIVDFCCNDKKLIIELDGSQHQSSHSDKIRDDFLKSKGYTVLRFWNNDLDNNIKGVEQAIYNATK
jgi:very-short-patch-repair endonuclease